MLDFSWLFKENNPTKVIEQLYFIRNETLFTTQMMTYLVDSLWSVYEKHVIKEFFWPYIVYFGITSLFTLCYMKRPQPEYPEVDDPLFSFYSDMSKYVLIVGYIIC